MELWNNQYEIDFFTKSLENFATPEQIFYHLSAGYYAYIPCNMPSEEQTLQSRNTLIGKYTEKWCKDVLEPIASSLGLFAVNGVICQELGLTSRSSADVAFCTTNSTVQVAKNIKVLFEIKMSIVSNYLYKPDINQIEYVGDYKSHKGQPSLLRSDSMLKAIGKSINIRVSGIASTTIPIFVLGNSPISESYIPKVDFLKTSGVIQGFLSLNPNPTTSNHVRNTPKIGFTTIEKTSELEAIIKQSLGRDLNFFSSMISKQSLGEIIYLAAQEGTEIERAEKFLKLIRN